MLTNRKKREVQGELIAMVMQRSGKSMMRRGVELAEAFKAQQNDVVDCVFDDCAGIAESEIVTKATHARRVAVLIRGQHNVD